MEGERHKVTTRACFSLHLNVKMCDKVSSEGAVHCCLLQLWWPGSGCGQGLLEMPFSQPSCAYSSSSASWVFEPDGRGGPRLSWVLGMLCKEKSHCFHCEILPQATYECSREDIHHFQQNSWQIHLLLLVILGAIFKCLSNVHSYSPSEKPSSSCMTIAREGDNKLLL